MECGIRTRLTQGAGRATRHFQYQDQDWHVAMQDIIAAREEVARTRPPGTEQPAAAPHEVAALDAAW
jgi:hypothetical protein